MAISTGAAILGAAGVGAAASIFGGNKAANAAKDASYLQAEAANSDRALQQYIYEKNLELSKPWLDEGRAGLTKLSDLLGTSGRTTAEGYGSLVKPFEMSDFQADPGYNFRLAEGEKAINRALSSKGKYFSGAAAKALTTYGQNTASEEFGNAYNRYNQNQSNVYNRLSNLAGLGQTQAQQVSQMGQNYANASGEAGYNSANALGAGQVGAANAWGSGLSGVSNSLSGGVNNLMLANYLGKIG